LGKINGAQITSWEITTKRLWTNQRVQITTTKAGPPEINQKSTMTQIALL
jgi:hypothetical protein